MPTYLSDDGIVRLKSAIVGNIKSKIQNRLVKMRVATRLNDEIGPPGIIGEKNYDIHYRTIRGLIERGDIKGAKEYVKKQKEKVIEQKYAR